MKTDNDLRQPAVGEVAPPRRERPDRALAASVIAAALEMTDLGLVTGTIGNVSVRHGGAFLITPTRRYSNTLIPDDVVAIRSDDLTSAVADRGASGEWRLHAAVYRARHDVNAIAHTHSPYAVARSFQPEPLTFWTEEATYLDLPSVSVMPHAAAGSVLLANSAVEALADRRGVLMERHGVLSVGDSPRDAVSIAAANEHQAQVQWLVLNATLARQSPTSENQRRRT